MISLIEIIDLQKSVAKKKRISHILYLVHLRDNMTYNVMLSLQICLRGKATFRVNRARSCVRPRRKHCKLPRYRVRFC